MGLGKGSAWRLAAQHWHRCGGKEGAGPLPDPSNEGEENSRLARGTKLGQGSCVPHAGRFAGAGEWRDDASSYPDAVAQH